MPRSERKIMKYFCYIFILSFLYCNFTSAMHLQPLIQFALMGQVAHGVPHVQDETKKTTLVKKSYQKITKKNQPQLPRQKMYAKNY
jgi:hypothetical protein